MELYIISQGMQSLPNRFRIRVKAAMPQTMAMIIKMNSLMVCDSLRL
jgi:hypothetical protein